MNIPEYVRVIIERLEAAGHEAYIVGGSLRDMLIGRAPSDFDVTTSALPEKTLALFSDMRAIPTGIEHGTITVLSDGFPIEVTTFRTDGEYLDSRHPESVSFTSDVCDDLSCRDFSMNAIAYNEKRGIVDPFCGREDINNKIIRAVGDPDTRMREDALRIMRALRFSAQLSFSIEENTLLALLRTKEGLANVSRERIAVELTKLVISPYPTEALRTMIDLGISKYVLGDYIPSERCISLLSTLPTEFFLRLSCLLWEAELDSAREILNSLKYSNVQKNGVLKVLSSRALPLPASEADIRRFIITLGEHAERAATLLSAFGCAPEGFCDKITKTCKTNFARKISDLRIDGSDFISLGFQGKEIGEVLEYLFNKVTDDASLNSRERLTEIIKSKDF